MDLHLGSLSRLCPAVSRSICAENPQGDAGGGGRAETGTGQAAARDLGRGWKVSPATAIEPGQSRLIADIEGPGSIQHVWMGVNGDPRLALLRIAWDGSEAPSVECPVGHFFACGWGGVEAISSLAVCMNPRNGLNCWWEMPFHVSCRLSVENVGPEPIVVYYQIDYTLAGVADDAGCFHAQFHRSVGGHGRAHAVLDGARGRGQYVGTYLAWQPGPACEPGNRRIEFQNDGTGDGREVRCPDLAAYFCSSNGFREFSTSYCGLARATGPEGVASPVARFGLYRWHIMDPIRFTEGLRVVIGAGDTVEGAEGRVTPGEEIASVAYWYQQP